MKDQSTTSQASASSSSEITQSSDEKNTSEVVSVTISAWMDGDEQTTLPSELFTDAGHATWQVYHLIGDTLRTPELALTPQADLCQRVAQALLDEPALSQAVTSGASGASRETNASVFGLSAAPTQPVIQTFTPLSKLLRRVVWPSLAMAAAAAAVVWVAKPLLVPELSAPSVQAVKANSTEVVASNLESSVVRDYVTAHRQFSSPANVRPAAFGASR